MDIRLPLLFVLLTSAEVLSIWNYLLNPMRTGHQENHIILTCWHKVNSMANVTFLKDREPIAVGTQYEFTLHPRDEAIFSCGNGEEYSEGVELIGE